MVPFFFQSSFSSEWKGGAGQGSGACLTGVEGRWGGPQVCNHVSPIPCDLCGPERRRRG